MTENDLPATEALRANGDEPSTVKEALSALILHGHEIVSAVRAAVVGLHHQRIVSDAELMAFDAVLIDFSNLADEFMATATEFEDQSDNEKEQAA